MYTVVSHLSGSREELSVFVEAGRHDSVGRVERLFDAVSVVHINVDVEDSLVISIVSRDKSMA